MISVIVVTYNQGATIGRTLDSILAQRTSEPYEIIIGDDCSSDGTESVCREYAARHPGRIRYLRREKNLGVVANYFDCIRRAKGDWLADCAGDDFWIDPRKLDKQIEAVRENPDLTIVATGWQESDPDGSNVRMPAGQAPQIHLCTALFSRRAVLKALEDSEGKLADPAFSNEDQPVIMACLAQGKSLILPDITLNYCVASGSVSHQTDPRKAFDFAFSTLAEQLWLNSFFGFENRNVALNAPRRINHLASMVRLSGDPERKKHLLALLKKHPELPFPVKARIHLLLSRLTCVLHKK